MVDTFSLEAGGENKQHNQKREFSSSNNEFS